MKISPLGLVNGISKIEEIPSIPRVTVVAEFESGQIRIERGADGAYLLFDCDCLDALPFCQAQCCGLKGILLSAEEEESKQYPMAFNEGLDMFEMRRDADGYCTCLNRDTRRCGIYENRPLTCSRFHCTRGSGMRGWKLPNQIHRQSGT